MFPIAPDCLPEMVRRNCNKTFFVTYKQKENSSLQICPREPKSVSKLDSNKGIDDLVVTLVEMPSIDVNAKVVCAAACLYQRATQSADTKVRER